MKRLLELKILKKFFLLLVEKFGDTAKSLKPDFLITEEIANELFDFLNETMNSVMLLTLSGNQQIEAMCFSQTVV